MRSAPTCTSTPCTSPRTAGSTSPTLDCDALVTSPYKWYGPHSGVLWMRPELLDALPVFKVRPAADHGPGRIETGMPNFEAIAGIEAAARFLIEEGMDRVAAAESEVFSLLLAGLQVDRTA